MAKPPPPALPTGLAQHGTRPPPPALPPSGAYLGAGCPDTAGQSSGAWDPWAEPETDTGARDDPTSPPLGRGTQASPWTPTTPEVQQAVLGPPPGQAPANPTAGPTSGAPTDHALPAPGWDTAICAVCGERTETRARPHCNLCDHLRDTLCLLARFRFTPAERQAALWSAAGLHRCLSAFAHSRPAVPGHSDATPEGFPPGIDPHAFYQ